MCATSYYRNLILTSISIQSLLKKQRQTPSLKFYVYLKTPSPPRISIWLTFRLPSLQLQVHADHGGPAGEDARRQDLRRPLHRHGQRQGDKGYQRRICRFQGQGQSCGDRGDTGVPSQHTCARHQGCTRLPSRRRPRRRPPRRHRRQPGAGPQASPMLQRSDIIVRWVFFALLLLSFIFCLGRERRESERKEASVQLRAREAWRLLFWISMTPRAAAGAPLTRNRWWDLTYKR